MKILTREAIFVNEYLQTKYKDIYREAASLYNEINKKYPQKPDLRKTIEFREWKNSVAVSNGEPRTYIPRQKTYKYNRTEYRDIKLTHTTETPPKENNHLNGCLTMCLNIPLMASPHHNASEETVTQQGDQPMDPSTPQQTLSVIQEGDQPMDPSTPQQTLSVTQQGDQPMDPSTPQQTLSVIQEGDQPMDPSTPQQTLSVTQQGDQYMDPSTPQQTLSVIQEGDQPMDPSTPQQTLSVTQQGDQYMDPSILDQIPPETVEKIIHELRNDPNLKDIMDDVEQQIEEELVGLEIDLPELDDLLEEELQLW